MKFNELSIPKRWNIKIIIIDKKRRMKVAVKTLRITFIDNFDAIILKITSKKILMIIIIYM